MGQSSPPPLRDIEYEWERSETTQGSNHGLLLMEDLADWEGSSFQVLRVLEISKTALVGILMHNLTSFISSHVQCTTVLPSPASVTKMCR